MIKTAAQLVQEVKQIITEISTSELAKRMADDILLVDVREPDEYAQGHIGSAINIPRGVLEMQLPQHPKVQSWASPLEQLNAVDIYLICRSGARSALAAESLSRLGLRRVYSISGGMVDWQQEGFSVVS